MNYLDIFLWVSASCLWLYVMGKIVGSIIDWFDGIKDLKNNLERYKNQNEIDVRWFTDMNKSQWESIHEMKARIEKPEKKRK
jgi:hypothetical protein